MRENVISHSDCYPFGMRMAGRYGSEDGAYRYGFQGQEMDDEVKGEGNSINYKYRMYDPRIGRFFAIDPLASKYPHNSPYAFSENVVIDHVELEGLEKARTEEIKWAVLNPVKAYYVRANKDVAAQAAMGMWKLGNLKGIADGEADAFRHAYWNALNARDIGKEKAEEIATLHELGETSPAKDPKNPQYDPAAIQMDLHNNEVGREIGTDNLDASDDEIKNLVWKSLKKGDLVTIKMNNREHPVNFQGNTITNSTEKVLQNSNGTGKVQLKGQSGFDPQKNQGGTDGNDTSDY